MGAQFCDQCGSPLSAEKKTSPTASQTTPLQPSATAQNSTESLRKHATVLFADIKGSTALIEGLDPEEARSILQPALKKMLNAVYRYNGTIIHTAGDGIVAIFGAPQALEDHALRACFAALAMLTETKSISEAILIRVGLHSGEVLLEIISDQQHLEYDITGPVVNLAARMEQTAKPGTIQMTRDTLQLVEHYAQAAPLGHIQVKGFQQPIDAYELKAIQEKKSLYTIKKRPVSIPFVGRDNELKLLETLLEQVKLNKGKIVSICAEPGQGKSRLVYEFIHSEPVKTCQYLVSGGFSHTSTIPLLPVFNLFRYLFQVSMGDTTDQIKNKVAPYISSMNSPNTINAVFSLLGITTDDPSWSQLAPQHKYKLTFEVGIKILCQLASQRPLLLLMEDMHWVDNETEAFLDLLIAAIDRSPILLLITDRPEYHDQWLNRSNYQQIKLMPLQTDSKEIILDYLLGHDASLIEIKRKLLAECAGNPFFMEEMIKSLISDKILIGEPQNYRLDSSQSVSNIHLPETIFAVLQTQIDKLTDAQKNVLQVASVIGERFTYSLIAQLVELDEKELRQALNALCNNQYIYERQIYPETEFSFKHGLIQEVAYHGLLKTMRRTLHLKIMTLLEPGVTDKKIDYMELVAHHAYLAEDWEKAFYYCKQAAEKSFLMLALKSALQFYDRALISAEHLKKNPPPIESLVFIHSEICQIVLRFGQFEKQIPHLEELMKLATASHDDALKSEVHSWYCFHYLGAKNAKIALKHAEQSYNIAKRTQDLDAILCGQDALMHSYLFLGQYTKQNTIGDELLTTTPNLGYYPRIHRIPFGYLTLFYTALSCAHLGDFAAIERKKSLLTTVDISQSSIIAVLALGVLGLTPMFKSEENNEQSIKNLSQAVAYSVDFDIMIYVPLFASWLGCILLRSQDLIEGEKYITLAVDIAKKIQFNFTAKLALGSLCEGLLLLGNYEKAKALTDESLIIAEEAALDGQKAWLLTISAEIDLCLPQPNWDTIKKKLDNSLQLTTQLNMLPHSGHGHFAKAKYYQGMGDTVESKKSLDTAMAIYQQLGMTYWIKQCEEFNLKFK